MAKRKGPSPNFPTREAITAFIAENPGRANKRDIARAFDIRGDDRILLKSILRGLISEGLLEQRPGKQLSDPTKLPNVAVVEIIEADVDGELWARPLGWKEDRPAPKILVVPDHRRRAAGPALGPGDRLLCRMHEVESDQYEARIIRALGQGSDRVIGVYELYEGRGRIRSTDRKGGKDHDVTGADTMGAEPGELVYAEVVPSRRHGRLQARIIERLGSTESARSLSLIAIHSHDIPTVFPPAAIEEAENSSVPPLGKRTDLRNVPLITIDPDEARDFDDAVWAAPDEDPDNLGGWQIIVAIADVSHYVRPGSALDREALKRGNSVYFPDRVVPMLPEALSAGMCSLKPGEERACMAVQIWIDAHGHKRRHKFIRGLMRSAGRLTYRQAQDAFDGNPGEVAGPLMDIAIKPVLAAHKALVKARDQRGPLGLEIPERKVRLDPGGEVVKIEPYPVLPSNRLIEDYMIAANVCAAESIEAARLPCMYRIHAEPTQDKLIALREFLETLDIPLAKGQRLKPELFNRILDRVRGTPHEHLVHQVVLRSQAQAVYSPDNIGHFGLALSRYAHFTSPIRRYADVLVHRALISAGKLGNDGLPRDHEMDFREIGEKISGTERRAMAAEREATDRYTALFLAKLVGAQFPGRISGVNRFGLFVTLNESGADGLIPIRTLGTEFFQHDETRHALVGQKTRTTYRLGDNVMVRLAEAEPLTGRMRFDLLDSAPGTGPALRRPTRAGSGKVGKDRDRNTPSRRPKVKSKGGKKRTR